MSIKDNGKPMIVIGKIFQNNLELKNEDVEKQWAECFVFAGNKILYVGSVEGANKKWNEFAKENTIQLKKDEIAMPSFIDSHVHPVVSGIQFYQFNLADKLDTISGLDDLEKILKDWSEKHPASSESERWLVGGGWRNDWFLEVPGKFPTADILDKMIPNRPCVLVAFDGHSVWANHLAMKEANITSETPEPLNGRIVRKENSTEPTGLFQEAAIKHFGKWLGTGIWSDNSAYPLPKRIQGLEFGISEMFRFGITGFQDAIVRPGLLETYLEYWYNQ